MGSRDEPRIFVGGLSWETTERQLEDAFGRFGKILEAQVMLERDSGRPRGFGFVTFADRRAMDDAILEMNNQDLNGRTITVNEAQPKPTDDPRDYDYGTGGRGGRGYSSGFRGPGTGGGYHDRDRGRGPPPVGNSDCFKCGRPGHWARECPSGDGGGGRFPSRPRFGGAPGGRGDRYGGEDRFGGGGRYVDDRYDGGRYGDRDRDRFDGRSNGRDRYSSDRYGGDHYVAGDRYGVGPDRYPVNGFGKERGSYDRDVPPRGVGDRYVGADRYVSGGPTRYEGGGGYRERPGPYDRPARVGRPSSYDR